MAEQGEKKQQHKCRGALWLSSVVSAKLEKVWTEVQLDMPFQIGGKHGQDGIREFVYDLGALTFLIWYR